MEQPLIGMKRHHHDLAERIVGTVALIAQHLTEDQLLARAREFYAKLVAQPATPLDEDA
jgi:hypothetical protein